MVLAKNCPLLCPLLSACTKAVRRCKSSTVPTAVQHWLLASDIQKLYPVGGPSRRLQKFPQRVIRKWLIPNAEATLSREKHKILGHLLKHGEVRTIVVRLYLPVASYRKRQSLVKRDVVLQHADGWTK